MDNSLPDGESTIANHVFQILTQLGEEPTREGLVGTPKRVMKSLKYLCSGYDMDLRDVVNGAIFNEDGDEMILVQGIELYSMCEHHMLPFFGQAAVAYVPNGKILGLSKVARIVEIYARRLQVQERLTTQVANAIREVVNPRGVAVVIEAKHLCMMMRGIQKQNSFATTSAMLGVFEDDAKTRAEFLQLIVK